jgi:Spy/CpxP family protein refolding chaperone
VVVRRHAARRVRALLLTPAAVLAAVLPAAGAAAPLVAQPAAQPPAGGPGAPGGMRGRGMQAALFEGITLTAAQQATVDSIQGASRERMRAQMQGGPPADDAARQARRQQMMAAMQRDRAALRAVLTADQQKTFDANVAALQERMRERMQGGGAPPRRR